jgi:hypothetical protein
MESWSVRFWHIKSMDSSSYPKWRSFPREVADWKESVSFEFCMARFLVRFHADNMCMCMSADNPCPFLALHLTLFFLQFRDAPCLPAVSSLMHEHITVHLQWKKVGSRKCQRVEPLTFSEREKEGPCSCSWQHWKLPCEGQRPTQHGCWAWQREVSWQPSWWNELWYTYGVLYDIYGVWRTDRRLFVQMAVFRRSLLSHTVQYVPYVLGMVWRRVVIEKYRSNDRLSVCLPGQDLFGLTSPKDFGRFPRFVGTVYAMALSLVNYFFWKLEVCIRWIYVYVRY